MAGLEVSLIAAVAANGVIGKDNDIPWRGMVKGEQKLFREHTRGKAVLMGRNTWNSIPAKFRPLPNRTNFVLTSQPDYSKTDRIEVSSIERAFLLATSMREVDEIVAMGGQRVYEEVLPYCDKLYLTFLEGVFPGDVYFPDINMNEWAVVGEDYFPLSPEEGRQVAYTFRILNRAPGAAKQVGDRL